MQIPFQIYTFNRSHSTNHSSARSDTLEAGKNLRKLSDVFLIKQLQDDVSVITVTDRHVELKDQLRDYQYRGDELSGMNFYEFVMNTYEETVRDVDITNEGTHTTQSILGRPRKIRIPYLAEANKPNKCRMQRAPGHEMLPRFIGRWYPRNNDPNGDNELHGASMLLLLKSWRNLTDLNKDGQSFQQSLAEFVLSASEAQKDMIENIQYYHDCWDVAQKRRDAIRRGERFNLFDYERQTMENDLPDDPADPSEGASDDAPPEKEEVDEHKIEKARLKQRNTRDREFADQAMKIAYAANVFGDTYKTSVRRLADLPRRATLNDQEIIDNWETVLKELTHKQFEREGATDLGRLHLYTRDSQPKILLNDDADNTANMIKLEGDRRSPAKLANESRNRSKLSMLNDDQRVAHDMIEGRMFGGAYNSDENSSIPLTTDRSTRFRATSNAGDRSRRDWKISSHRRNNRNICSSPTRVRTSEMRTLSNGRDQHRRMYDSLLGGHWHPPPKIDLDTKQTNRRT